TKTPESRYAAAADLADDIRRHLAREPVVARHPTLGYRAKCLIKRNGSRLVARTAGGIVLGGGLVRVLGSVSTRCRRGGGHAGAGSHCTSVGYPEKYCSPALRKPG